MRPLGISFTLCLAITTTAFAEPAARTIVLVRHGHYLPDPAADPTLGPGLSVLGVAQARLAGARLAGQEPDETRILASPLTRAQETARVIAQDLGRDSDAIQTIGGLAECTPPTRQKAITAEMAEEDLVACAKQLDQVFADHFKPADGTPARELLICHGNVIRYLITKAIGVDSDAWLEMSVGHTSFNTIRIEANGQIKVIGAGDVGHVPPNLRTGATGDPERDLKVPDGG